MEATGWRARSGTLVVEEEGPRCSCRDIGCLETVISGPEHSPAVQEPTVGRRVSSAEHRADNGLTLEVIRMPPRPETAWPSLGSSSWVLSSTTRLTRSSSSTSRDARHRCRSRCSEDTCGSPSGSGSGKGHPEDARGSRPEDAPSQPRKRPWRGVSRRAPSLEGTGRAQHPRRLKGAEWRARGSLRRRED